MALVYRMETKRRGLKVPLAPGCRPDMSLRLPPECRARFRPFPLPTIGYWNRAYSPDLQGQRRWSPVVESIDRKIDGRQVVIGGRKRL